MRRREFLGLFSGAAAAWPLTVRAQQPRAQVIGFLSIRSIGPDEPYLAALRRGLREAGHIADQDVVIEYRSAEGRNDLLATLAAELANRPVDILVGSSLSTQVFRTISSSIPIVFLAGGDPMRRGLISSFNRPGGNATGVHIFTNEIDPKRLGLLRDLIPSATTIAILLNPRNADAEVQLKGIQEAAIAVGQNIEILNAANVAEIEQAFATMARSKVGALLVGADPFFNGQRDLLVVLAARHAVPAIYEWREFALAGGFASYGTSLVDAYRQVGVYAGRILNGERPAELPVLQAAKFEFVINLRTARALGLTLPPTVLARADEVIE
jgi:putative ABC transport system substrate-binding protein